MKLIKTVSGIQIIYLCPVCNNQAYPLYPNNLDNYHCPNCDPPIYTNKCWNCQTMVNSKICKLSPNPGMGYVCNACGKDLTEWKEKNEPRSKNKRKS